MASTIKLRRGAVAGLPSLAAGEPAFTTDTFKVYVGSAGGNKVIGGPTVLFKDEGGTIDGNVVIGTGKTLTLAGNPTSDLHAATKQYVDATRTGLDVKASCRAATTINITLSGEQAIDGVSVVAGNRVLVKNQSTASQNGIYVAAVGAWVRSTDADADAEVTAGMFTFIEEGTANADSGWVLTTNDPIVIGTTALTFAQFSGAGDITAGAGLTKTGTTLDVGAGDGIQVDADSVTIKLDGTTLTKAAAGLKVSDAKVANWDAAYTHISSSGADHTFIDQAVKTSSSPSFVEVSALVDGGVW